ncbi:MAG: UDP-N-acetylmuramate dehydrogenase [Candidatus Paceibacterota bacterium]
MIQLENLNYGEPLAPHTTYGIGGPADYFFRATDKHALARAIREARNNNIPYFILGMGANVLFGDKGFRGLVIKNEARKFNFVEQYLTAESGALIGELIQATEERGLSGLEHYAGIPSTVGGALWQNLHFLSPDRTRTVFIDEVFASAKILNEDNKILTVGWDYFDFKYDHSILHERPLVVLEATFSLAWSSKELVKKQSEENLRWRNEKHPTRYLSCGSVFKKIEGVGAGRLIEQVGMKGYSIGGIQSSEQHANFLVNTGNGTAAQVMELIGMIHEKVKKQTGYVLEPEINFIGEF